jgi:hypothetical protein
MLFLREEDIKDFDNTIGEWYDKNPIVALFLAVASFEWTARRVLLAITSKSTLETRKALGCVLDIDRYSEEWKVADCGELVENLFVDEKISWGEIVREYKKALAYKVESSHDKVDSTRWIVIVLFYAVKIFFRFAENKKLDLNNTIVH